MGQGPFIPGVYKGDERKCPSFFSLKWLTVVEMASFLNPHSHLASGIQFEREVDAFKKKDVSSPSWWNSDVAVASHGSPRIARPHDTVKEA